MVEKFSAPKGVSEYFPPRSRDFETAIEKLLEPARSAGYQLIELPIFEDTELFTRGVGGSTDVVTKEMYTFQDRAGRSITLRPEGTAGVARSVIEHGLERGQLPIKVFYKGPFFRAERPQAGRYRQFFQVGIEAIGVDDPALDAEVIYLAQRALHGLGLRNFTLKISSLGDNESRSKHRIELMQFISELDLDQETLDRVAKNPLRLFDDKRKEIIEAMENAPLIRDFLTSESKENYEAVKSYLRDLGIAFEEDPRMVRGLDYYTGTTFEFLHHGLGAQSAIGGGGRYDGLLQALGGSQLSGIGFGLGVDRALLALEAEGITLEHRGALLDLYLIAISPASKTGAISLLANLRELGLRVDMSYGDRALKGAMKAADKQGAKFTLVLGDDELSSERAELKNMATGEVSSVKLTASEITSSIKK
jgi:histidyl-tRNA synthetase